MTEERRYCSDVIEKVSSKELVITKEENGNFKNYTKCWISDNDCIDNDVKLGDYCHITRICRALVHRNCNINLKVSNKILVVFHNPRKL